MQSEKECSWLGKDDDAFPCVLAGRGGELGLGPEQGALSQEEQSLETEGTPSA